MQDHELLTGSHTQQAAEQFKSFGCPDTSLTCPPVGLIFFIVPKEFQSSCQGSGPFQHRVWAARAQGLCCAVLCWGRWLEEVAG